VDKIGGLDAAIKRGCSVRKTKKYTTQNPEYNKDVNDLLAGFLLPNPKKISSNKKLAKKIIIYYKK
jgi:hypothetical protein